MQYILTTSKTLMMTMLAAGCAVDVGDGASDELTDDETSTIDQAISAPCGGYTVQGAIEWKYYDRGGTFFFGCPTNNETATPPPRTEGRYNHFAGNASIYFTPATGPHEVHGLIRDKWARMGWEKSVLGFPITDESYLSWGPGRYNHFEGGSIYWLENTPQAFEVHGLIRVKWAATGWERGILGYPTSDELATPLNPGRFSNFEFGSIYWKAGTPEAFIVLNEVRNCWGKTNWESGAFGFPTGDTRNDWIQQAQSFEHGVITYLYATRGCAYLGYN